MRLSVLALVIAVACLSPPAALAVDAPGYVTLTGTQSLTLDKPEQFTGGFNLTDASTLLISGTSIRFDLPRGAPTIILRDSATLVVENSTIYTPNGVQIYAEGQAKVRVTGSRLRDAWEFTGEPFSGVTLAEGSQGTLTASSIGFITARDNAALTVYLVECNTLTPRSKEPTLIRRSIVTQLKILFVNGQATLTGSLSGYYSHFDSKDFISDPSALSHFVLLESGVESTTVTVKNCSLTGKALTVDRVELIDSDLTLLDSDVALVDLQQGTVKLLINNTSVDTVSSFAHHIDVTIIDSQIGSADLGYTGSGRATTRNARISIFFLDPASFPAEGAAEIIDSVVDVLLVRARNTRYTFRDSAVTLAIHGVYTACKDGEYAVIRGSLLTSSNTTVKVRPGAGAIIREYTVEASRGGAPIPGARIDLWNGDSHLAGGLTDLTGKFRFNMTYTPPPTPPEDADEESTEEPPEEPSVEEPPIELVVKYKGETLAIPLGLATNSPIKAAFQERSLEKRVEPLALGSVMLLLLFLGWATSRRR